MYGSDQTLKFLTADITTSAAIRLPQYDLAATVANITKQLQILRQQEAGCIVVVCWKCHKYMQCQKFRSQKKKSLILNVQIFGNSGMYLWMLRGLLTLPTSRGREKAQVLSRKYGKVSCN